MKKYKYVRLDYIEEYDDWEIIKIIPAINEDMFDMAVLSFKDTPKEDKKIIKLNTNWQYAFDIQVEQDTIELICKKINEIIDKVNGEE